MTRRLFSFLMLLFFLCVSTTTFAQVPPKALKVNMDTDFLKFNIGGWNPSGPEDWRFTNLDAGIGTANLAVGMGVTLAEALAIGLRFSIAHHKESMKFDEDDSELDEEEVLTDFDSMKITRLTWGISPFIEYAFGERVVRPFIMALIGFEGSQSETYYQTTNFWDFVLGLGGGIHLFAAPTVSVDLTILLGFSAGGGGIQLNEELFPPPTEDDAGEQTFTRILFRLTGGLGISGWF